MIERWSCESYCLCGSRKGHFEKSDQGVWVLYESAAKLLSARLQQVEELKELLARFKELLDLDPENHPGTDLGRLMLEAAEAIRPTPQGDKHG